MSDLEPLREFAKFRAAMAWEIGSATDIRDADVAAIAGEVSTHPYIARRRGGQLALPLSALRRPAESGSPTGSPDIVICDSAPTEAPLSDFEVLDELRTPQGRIRRQIRALRGGSKLPYRERLACRLEFLLGAPEEEGEEWGEHSPESLRQMFLFLQDVPDFRYPTVGVTPSATFRAQWQGGRNEHFAVDFPPDGQARFVVFAPDPRHPERVQRVSGVVSRADIRMKAIEPYKVHRWAADART